VELLMVVAILAILASLLGLRFTGRSQEARVRAAETQLREFNTALDAFQMKAGHYPATEQGLEALVEKPPGLDIKKWSGRLMSHIPRDPWGNQWQYRYPGKHNASGYDLYSFGPDGRQGGGDDITNWSDGG